MPQSYKQPRRLNVVTLALLVLVAAGGYYAWKWGPPYLQSWKVDEILQQGAAAVPSFGQEHDSRIVHEQELATKLTGQIRELGITDPDLVVTVDDDGTDAHLVAEWTVLIDHPGKLHAPSADRFRREVVQPLHVHF